LFPDKQDVQQIAVLSDMLSALHDIAGQLHLAGYVSAAYQTWSSGMTALLIRFRADRPTGRPASAGRCGQASSAPGGGF
jgi:hypothetical protein